MPPVIPDPPLSPYVPMGVFELTLGVIGTLFAAAFRMIWKLFHKTSRLEALPGQIAKMEENIMHGQQGLKTDVEVVRHTLTDVMLQRGRGADVDRYEPRRRNGEE